MYKNIALNYEDILHQSQAILEYAFENADSFSLISKMKKPFSRIPPIYEHCDQLEPISRYLLDQRIGIREWPGTYTRDCHRIMNVYKCCYTTKNWVLLMPCVFDFSRRPPEDICFYRKNVPWFVTTTHEKYAYMWDPSENDLKFLDRYHFRHSP